MAIRKLRINEQITSPELRVVGDNGEQLGLLRTDKALAAAKDAGLDLVEVAPTAVPPVARLMDFTAFVERHALAEVGERGNKAFPAGGPPLRSPRSAIAGGNTQPFRCPICGGNGQVGNGFYSTTNLNQGALTWSSTSTSSEKCRTCGGTGIVWRPA